MKIKSLNRKAIFDFSQKVNSFYIEKEIDKEIYLRILYYYFVSSKQITTFIEIFKFDPKNNDDLLHIINQVYELQNDEPDKFDYLVKEIQSRNGFFLEKEMLIPVLIDQGIENFNPELLIETFNYLSNVLTPVIIDVNVNELFLVDKKTEENIFALFEKLSSDLIFGAKELVEQDASTYGEIYADLFEYIIIHIEKRSNLFKLPYIPSFFSRVIKRYLKLADWNLDGLSIGFKGDISPSIIKDFQIDKEFANCIYDVQSEELTKVELDFLYLVGSLSSSNFSILERIGFDYSRTKDLIFASQLNPVSTTINFANYSYDVSSLVSEKSRTDYRIIIDTIEDLSDNGVAFILLPTSSLSRKNGKRLRKFLVENNYVEGVINLPNGIIENSVSRVSLLIIKKVDVFDYLNNDNHKILGVNAYLTYKKNNRMKYLDEVHTNDIADAVLEKKEYKDFSSLITSAQLSEVDYNFDINHFIPLIPTKRLSVKKMLQELEQARTELEDISKEIKK